MCKFLTCDKVASRLAQSNCTHAVLAQVDKFKGVVKPLRAFSKPKILNL